MSLLKSERQWMDNSVVISGGKGLGEGGGGYGGINDDESRPDLG